MVSNLIEEGRKLHYKLAKVHGEINNKAVGFETGSSKWRDTDYDFSIEDVLLKHKCPICKSEMIANKDSYTCKSCKFPLDKLYVNEACKTLEKYKEISRKVDEKVEFVISKTLCPTCKSKIILSGDKYVCPSCNFSVDKFYIDKRRELLKGKK